MTGLPLRCKPTTARSTDTVSSADRLLTIVGRGRRSLGGGSRIINRHAYYHDGWTAAALQLGHELTDLGSGFLRLIHTGGATIFRDAVVGVDDIATYQMVGDKLVTDRLLRQAGVPRLSCQIHSATSRALLSELGRDGWKQVIKPVADTGGGQGVTVSPGSRRLALRAIMEASAYGTQIMSEDHQPGRVCRALVFDGEVIDTVVRDPAQVIGDGESSVAELVKLENQRRMALGDRSTGFIETGTDFLAAVSRQEQRRSDIPLHDQLVTVSGRSNSGSELESRRLTLGAPAKAIASLAAEAVGVRLAGVDLVLDDTGAVAAVLEVNTTPGLHWHSLVNGEPYDVFVEVMRRVAAQ